MFQTINAALLKNKKEKNEMGRFQADSYWFSAEYNSSSIGEWFCAHAHPYLKIDGCHVWPVREESRKFRNGIAKNQGE